MSFQTISRRLNTPLYRFWLIANVVMGLFFCIVVPPFQSPDEWHHFLKINHLIEGHFYGEVDTTQVSLGGTVPKSVQKIIEPYTSMRWNEAKKSNPDTFQQVLNTPLSKNDKIFVAFPNTARYAPLAYAPQVVSMGLTRCFDLNPAYTMYIGRIANFAFWLVCITFVYLLTPAYKDIFLYITLIPGTISIHATLSADVFTNGCLFLMIALFFRFKFGENPISKRDLGAFWVLSLITTWTKIVYFPIVFLFLLVPKTRLEGLMPKFQQLALGILFNLIIIFWWNGAINKMVYPFGDTQRTTYHNLHENEDLTGFVTVNPRLQTERILEAPLSFAGRFLLASTELYSYCNTTYTSNIGWESIRIPRWLHGIMLVVLILYLGTQNTPFKRWEKWSLVVLAHTLSCVFLLSQHLHWDEVGAPINVRYIGKYYIPIFPLVFFALAGWLFKYKPRLDSVKLDMILRGVFLVSYCFMVYLTIERFYGF